MVFIGLSGTRWSGAFERAIHYAEKVLERDPRTTTQRIVGIVYHAKIDSLRCHFVAGLFVQSHRSEDQHPRVMQTGRDGLVAAMEQRHTCSSIILSSANLDDKMTAMKDFRRTLARHLSACERELETHGDSACCPVVAGGKSKPPQGKSRKKIS